MIIKLILTLSMVQPQSTQQQAEQESKRQQMQLDQMQNELQKEFGRVRDLIEKQRPPGCSADLRWVTGGQDVKVGSNANAVIPMNLFSTISRPSNTCLAAEITVSASYLDAFDNLVCTGVIDNIATQSNLNQSINLDVRPWNLREFARWRNEPPEVNSGAKRLICMNPEGLAEATPEDLARVASVRVRATVLPANGGMSSVEFKLRLR